MKLCCTLRIHLLAFYSRSERFAFRIRSNKIHSVGLSNDLDVKVAIKFVHQTFTPRKNSDAHNSNPMNFNLLVDTFNLHDLTH